MGAGMSAFEAKMTAKSIPWATIMAMIQALLAALGVCPKPPTNKAELHAVPLKRARLRAAGRREGLSWADATAAADAALAVLDESDETEVVAFLADVAA